MAFNLTMSGDDGTAQTPLFVRYPKNAPGPFYVEDGYCLCCGLVPDEAPELMVGPLESDGIKAHCYFRRQPETPEEVQKAIDAMFVSEASSLRYGGDDPAILQHLSDHGLGSLCDQSVPPPRPNPPRLWEFAASLRAASNASDPSNDAPNT